MSSPKNWERLKSIVTAAELLSVTEREAYISAQCEGDDELRSEASALIAGQESAGGFLDASPMRELPFLGAGTLLGSFRVLEPLGGGGMGDVYLAERADGTYDERVAIKVIRAAAPPGSELHARFRSETRLLAELRHPNIAQLLDAGTTHEGRPYFVMELIEGEPIDVYCQQHGLDLEARLRLLVAIADAVTHAHRHLVVHRDLKPANILVTTDGVPKLLDFGIAKDLRAMSHTPETSLLVPITPEYASPEQLTGKTVSTATDVYSLGVVLYELLVGASPFGGDRGMLAGRSEDSQPPRPSSRVPRDMTSTDRTLRRRLRGDLDYLVLRALAPEPADRYASVEAMRLDMERFLDGRPLAARPGNLYRVDKWIRRHWLATGAAALIVALTAGWLVEGVERRSSDRESRRVATVSRGMGTFVFDLLAKATPQEAGRRDRAMERVVEEAAALLDRPGALSDEPLLRAALQGGVGQVQRKLGLYPQAELRLRECLEIRQRLLPADDPDTARAANNLALALRGQDRHGEARDFLIEAEQIIRPQIAGNEGLWVGILNNRGGVEKELGNTAASVRYFQESLELRQRQWPENHKSLAMAHKNLAVGLLADGRLDSAEKHLDRADQELWELGQSEPSAAAGIRHQRGKLALARGQHQTARELLGSACLFWRQTLPKDSSKASESCAMAVSLGWRG